MVKNSINKLNEQISMLSNEEFIDKPNTNKKYQNNKVRKPILKETSKSSLMSDLITDDEDTKVFVNNTKPIIKSQNKSRQSISNRNKSISNTTYPKKINKKNKLVETITFGKVTFNQEKVENVYLPLFLILLIVVFIILIIMI